MKDKRGRIQHVFLVGAKNIGKYGGYETFVDKLTECHQGNGRIQYHVACKKNGDDHMDESRLSGVRRESEDEFWYHNARCFKVPVLKLGPAQAVYYDLMALRQCCDYIRENQITRPVIYIMACRIGPFLAHYQRVVHRFGGRIYLNPDGHEWMRRKWSLPVRRYWKFSEHMMVRHSDLIVCDSVNIERYIRKVYGKKRADGVATTYIAYGADTGRSSLRDDAPAWTEWYRQNGIVSGGYYLAVGRFVPENNYEIMLREFMRSDTDKKLVIITTPNDRLYQSLNEKLHFEADKRIRFAGTVYNPELLKKIRENAYGYIHGHEAGGTNPSLLEAMGSTDLNLLLDVKFNREVGEQAALYWKKDQGSLADLIQKADRMSGEERSRTGELARKRILEHYSWEYIAGRYEEEFLRER